MFFEKIMTKKSDAIKEMIINGRVSVPYLQRKLYVSFEQAKAICEGIILQKKPIENGCNSKHKIK